jgi:microcystin-dependent protein
MEGYLAQIMLFAGGFAPNGWAYCQGQTLKIISNSALFALVGTTYGGDGRNNFALPNFAGRTAVGTGAGAGLSQVSLGEKGGSDATTLTTSMMPAHTHTLNASANPGTAASIAGNVLANAGTDKVYLNAGSPVGMKNESIGVTGGNQPFDSRQPYLGINYVICLSGIYPSRPN